LTIINTRKLFGTLAISGVLVSVASRVADDDAPERPWTQTFIVDRAENTSLSVSERTPASKFKDCLLVEETTLLEAGEKAYKIYAAGVGLIIDGPAKLVRTGFPSAPK
jgi:hypothetical protein